MRGMMFSLLTSTVTPGEGMGHVRRLQATLLGDVDEEPGGGLEFCAATEAMRNARGIANAAFAIVIFLWVRECIVKGNEVPREQPA